MCQKLKWQTFAVSWSRDPGVGRAGPSEATREGPVQTLAGLWTHPVTWSWSPLRRPVCKREGYSPGVWWGGTAWGLVWGAGAGPPGCRTASVCDVAVLAWLLCRFSFALCLGLCFCLCLAFVLSLFHSLFKLSLAFVWSFFSLLFELCVAFLWSLCSFCFKCILAENPSKTPCAMKNLDIWSLPIYSACTEETSTPTQGPAQMWDLFRTAATQGKEGAPTDFPLTSAVLHPQWPAPIPLCPSGHRPN